MWPWVAGFHACVALRWVFDPQRPASHGIAASVAMAGFAALVLWLVMPLAPLLAPAPGDLRHSVCDAFSPDSAAYGAAGVTVWLRLAAVARRSGDGRARVSRVPPAGARLRPGCYTRS